MAMVNIELEVISGINSEGIYAHLYTPGADDPITFVESWENVLDQELEYGSLLSDNQPLVVEQDYNSVEELMDVVENFRDLADRLEEKVKSRPVFMRDQWVEALTSNSIAAINDYCVTFEKYMELKDD